MAVRNEQPLYHFLIKSWMYIKKVPSGFFVHHTQFIQEIEYQ